MFHGDHKRRHGVGNRWKILFPEKRGQWAIIFLLRKCCNPYQSTSPPSPSPTRTIDFTHFLAYPLETFQNKKNNNSIYPTNVGVIIGIWYFLVPHLFLFLKFRLVHRNYSYRVLSLFSWYIHVYSLNISFLFQERIFF